MHRFPFLLTASLVFALSGCGTEPVFCPSVLAVLTANVVNASGQPLSGLSVTDTVRRTGAVLHVLGGSPTDTLPVDGSGRVPIFPDSAGETLTRGGDEIRVVVAAEGHSVTGLYRLAFNGCLVQRLVGPDTLVIR